MTTQLLSNVGTYRDFNTGEVTLDIDDLLQYFNCPNWEELCDNETRVNTVIDIYLTFRSIKALNEIEAPF